MLDANKIIHSLSMHSIDAWAVPPQMVHISLILDELLY